MFLDESLVRGMSVGRLICRSVGRSVGQLVGRLVGRSVTLPKKEGKIDNFQKMTPRAYPESHHDENIHAFMHSFTQEDASLALWTLLGS